jgi:ribosomal protein S18
VIPGETFLLSNLSENSVISPRSLSPNYLLTPYLPRPDLSRAFPLGPPTTEKYTLDPFLTTGISPMASPMNPYLRAEFCTSMGKIKSRGKTQLQRRSQRALGKAVRRARVRPSALPSTS